VVASLVIAPPVIPSVVPVVIATVTTAVIAAVDAARPMRCISPAMIRIIMGLVTIYFVAISLPSVAASAAAPVIGPPPAFAALVFALALVVPLRGPGFLPCLERCNDGVMYLALRFGCLSV
jgi:hypothetical protein